MYSPTCFFFFLFFWMLTILSLSTTTTANEDTDTTNKSTDGDEDIGDGFRQLVAWVKQHGGRVADESFQIQQLDDDDGGRGGVALADIAKGTELFYIPWDLVLGSTSLQRDHHQTLSQDDMCSVIESIDEELRLGRASNWYLYLKLHHDGISKMPARLTSFWTKASLEQLQGLPPQEDGNRYLQKTTNECVGTGSQQQLFLSKFMKEALVLYLTRSTALGMVPIYDLFNHHNGYRNAKLELPVLAKTKSKSKVNGNNADNDNSGGIQLIATQDISAGSQIYISYGFKSSSSMFRDFGFVESWPQLWIWKDGTYEHTLVLLDNNVTVIYPTAELIQEFRQLTTTSSNNNMSSSSLSSFQQLGMQHNSRNLSRDVLVIFEASARKLLDSLPTTVPEDFGILAEMKRELQLAQENINNNNNRKQSPRQAAMIQEQSDSISAVEYRIKFKQAVQTGLDAVRQILLQDGQQTSSSTTGKTQREL